jgi:hypothetical protein
MEYLYTAILSAMVGYGLGAWSWSKVWAWLLGEEHKISEYEQEVMDFLKKKKGQ